MQCLNRFVAALLLLTLLPVFAFAHIEIDPTAIPLGDGKVSTSPKVGYVWSCQTQFNQNAGGAQSNGPWIHGAIWNMNEKISVQGAVTWPNAVATFSVQDTLRIVTGNGLPVNTATGLFPVAAADPAYQIDRNPNTISSQNVSYSIPLNPVITSPSCVPMGTIGIALNGAAIFNALDGPGRDAAAHEVLDACGGHPERSGQYHYHANAKCIPSANETNGLVGYALDGFGIVSGKQADGTWLSNGDLDECHGTTSPIMWNGKSVSIYHYVITREYPYTLGCYRGVPTQRGNGLGSAVQNIGNAVGGFVNSLLGRPAPSSLGSQRIVSSLRMGQSGEEVIVLQTILEREGLLTFAVGQSKGYFGTKTRDALKKYQRAHGLEATGATGPKTRALLNGSASPAQPSFDQQNGMPQGQDMSGRQNGAPPMPPPEAVAACEGKVPSSSCVFQPPFGGTVSGQCSTIGQFVACKPSGGGPGR